MMLDNLIVEEQLVYDYYKVYMDIEIINVKGIMLINFILIDIDNLLLVKEFIEFFGESWFIGVLVLLYGGLWYNCLDLNEYQLSVGVGGFGLFDCDYYFNDLECFSNICDVYVKYIVEMLIFVDVENLEEKVQIIFVLEIKIVEIQWLCEKCCDCDLILNQVECSVLVDMYFDFDWNVWLDVMGFKVFELNIFQL